jgi:hypothetical protein
MDLGKWVFLIDLDCQLLRCEKKKKKEEEKINENIKNKENIYTEKERKREI